MLHSLDPSRTSAQRKLARGIEQIQTLRGEARAFEESEAYVFRTEREERSAKEIVYRTFARQREAPPFHWPLLGGEAIQNLRSALEHAVWAIPKRKGRAQYPIFTDPCEFQVKGLPMLRGVPKPIQTLIEGTQPYRRLPNAPAQDALEQLHTLSNLDKHRVLTTFAVAVKTEGWSHAYGVNFRIEQMATDVPLGDVETQVQQLVAFAEVEGVEVDVHPDFTYQVRIERRPLNVFEVIVNRVFEAVEICETGKTPPFSAYPLQL